ncbi:MAG: right-handed parallel beta-helix repeat-containing protein [Alphaproteobacteria bacterium]|nr:right-handed parallel beta-helix repeat-containing protein [Alphaproteobacteria bacterium]
MAENGVKIVVVGVLCLAVLYWNLRNYLPGGEVLSKERLQVEIVKWNEPIEKPYLPDISGFTYENLLKRVPKVQTGRVYIDKMKYYPEFKKFLEKKAPQKLRLIQRQISPRALVIKSGHYDWKTLYKAVHTNDPESKIIEKQGDDYILRMPLLVLRGASLTISGIDVNALKISAQSNAFLVNAGDLYILRTKVYGWDEEKNDQAWFDLEHYKTEKYKYRPFIATWGGGGLYLVESDFYSMGYSGGKSYGLSYSACTPCQKVDPDVPEATGWVLNNRFYDFYYGFYSYEAEDVAIIGNTYIDNIVYGIDPHDRSRRLIIAKNEAYGTKKKHGIIISREVNDGWIFDNHSHHNKGSGFMIDRTSVNNVIANNIAEYNEQDGLTFFESEDNITWGNVFRYNKKNGLRIRNSWDIHMYNDEIYGNGGTSVEVYTANIDGHETRDLDFDPYTQKAGVTVRGAKIRTSGAAAFKITNAELLGLSNIKLWAGTHILPNYFDYDKDMLLENLEKEDVMIKIQSSWFPDAKPPVKKDHHGAEESNIDEEEYN